MDPRLKEIVDNYDSWKISLDGSFRFAQNAANAASTAKTSCSRPETCATPRRQ